LLYILHNYHDLILTNRRDQSAIRFLASAITRIMTLLQVQTLGVPEVRYQEKRLKFRSRKALALLIYLAVESGTHSREKLIDLFWPHSDDRQGRISLRTALSQVRQALRVTGSPGIVTTHDLVRLDDERPLQLDLNLITAALRPEATAADWQKAITASHGPFLEGFSLADASGFDEWVSWQCEHWHNHLEHVFQHLATYQLDRGEGEQAVQTTGQWVAHSSLNETAYLCLMAAQARTGNRTAALQTYQQCQHALKADLDIAPGPEISALAERIRQGELRKLEHETTSPLAPRSTRLPFVGRAMEYSQLVTALRMAVQGTTTVTAVIGAAGMGKTHLVEAFLDGAQFDRAGVDILRGRAYEMGGRLPYQPLVAALRARLEQENAPEDLLDDVWLAELSQLFPELRARYPDLPLPLTGGADFVRARLFAAVAQLGRALAARRPLILFLDDWQWAEDSSLEILHYLSQSWAETDTPLMLVLTMRQEALLTTLALQEWLMGIARDVPVTRVELAALTAADIQQFVRQMAASEASHLQPDEDNAVRQFGDWLYQETAGQPFFLHERVKMLVEQTVLRPLEGDGRSSFDIPSAWQQLQSQKQLPLPPTVRQALLARQSRLSQTATALLWASAVLARDCTFDRLCQVAGVADLDGLPALEELLNGRFILENRSAQRPYTFAHDYIREVAYTEAGEARRRLFHQRALAALEQAEAQPAELAFHALAAQLDEPAFRYCVAAGDAATQAHAYAEALAYYDQARELANTKATLSAVDSQPLCQLYTNRGRVLELNQQFEAAQDNYEEMIGLAAENDDSAMRLAALTSQCIVRATQTPLYDMAKARTLADEALALARQLGDKATEAKVLWGLLLVETWGEGDNEKALAYGLRSLVLAREMGLKEQMGFTYHDLANVYRNLSQLADAQRATQAALAIWQELGNLPMLVDAYTMQHVNYFLVGELTTSLTFVEEALQLSRSINHKWGQVVSLGYMINALIEIGDPGRAAEMISERARLTKAVGSGFHPTYKYLVYQHQLSLALSLGTWDRVAQLTIELYENRHDLIPAFFHYIMAAVIQFMIAQGNPEQAQQIWDEISPDWHLDKSAPLVAGPLSATELYLLLAQSSHQVAQLRAQDIVAYFRRIGCIVYLPEVLWLQGRAEMGLKQWTQAKETLTEALKISQNNGERRLRWRILASLMEIAQAQRKQSEADRYKKMGQEVIRTITSYIENEELHTAFLATTAVQHLFLAN
jgi:DNA-binding SARP family transcriptional activator/tetratricopeptide (TPR) repeat protein